MNKIIPIGQFLPYTLSDLSVVIPQASQYVNRIKWFIPQYIKMTPPEVIKNTIVVYDPEDEETRKVLEQYDIKGITVTPPHSTYKQEAGFNHVKTRLCARVHNDSLFIRSDWAETLIEKFNQTPTSTSLSTSNPQLIGAFNISGGIDKERLDKLVSWYPCFKPIYDNLAFSEAEAPTTGAPFLSAGFMASQTYVWRGIYPLVVEFNEGKMDKEDVITTLLFSVIGVIITSWLNMYSFVKDAGGGYGDFDEGFTPLGEQFMVTSENKANFTKGEYQTVLSKAEFKEVVS